MILFSTTAAFPLYKIPTKPLANPSPSSSPPSRRQTPFFSVLFPHRRNATENHHPDLADVPPLQSSSTTARNTRTFASAQRFFLSKKI
jgi:hypothetical protein